MAKGCKPPPPREPKQFHTVQEIDRAIAQIQRRVDEVENLGADTAPDDE
jgi:hypothetical protein